MSGQNPRGRRILLPHEVPPPGQGKISKGKRRDYQIHGALGAAQAALEATQIHENAIATMGKGLNSILDVTSALVVLEGMPWWAFKVRKRARRILDMVLPEAIANLDEIEKRMEGQLEQAAKAEAAQRPASAQEEPASQNADGDGGASSD